ncbi:uncharacterized protein LOC124648970 [Lolium rigidum]|uniref:uncharacterized protein LOC124648970 n=1 Tax=Lolium rigidum TaxID=89674 RepID=UPI001F5CEC70|nr:uncharacterized protein LOC124648970 [Lolium rigidum]
MSELALSHEEDKEEEEGEDGDLEDTPLDPSDVLRFVQSVCNVEPAKRLNLMRDALGVPPKPRDWPNISVLPESSRHRRHVGDLYWHQTYQMNQLSETCLPPMRYTQCCDQSTVGQQRCFHKPCPMLQIFSTRVQLADYPGPTEVYGCIAVRDSEDYRRIYLFNRSRDDPLTINSASDYLRLLSPKRGMSMQFDCLVEVDIRTKALSGDADDKILVDGCFDLIEGRATFDVLSRSVLEGEHGAIVFDLIMFRRSVEATIHMNFLEVPGDGFDIKMCGFTAIWKNLYAFIDCEQCECDSFVSSTGKFTQYFVAAVQMDDTLFIDFMEGNMPISFEAAIHGTEEKVYYFRNGAVVSVKVSWSTAHY